MIQCKQIIISIILMVLIIAPSYSEGSIQSIKKRIEEITKLADNGHPVEAITKFYNIIDKCATKDEQTYCDRKAVEICKRFLTEYANDKVVIENTLYLLAESYWYLENYSEGLKVCEEFLKKYPMSSCVEDILFLKGKCCYRTEDYKQALEIFSGSSWLKEDLSFHAQFTIACCYNGLQKYELAIKQYQKFIDSYPKHEWSKEALIRIGDCYGYQCNYNNALKIYSLTKKRFFNDKRIVKKAQEKIREIYVYRIKKNLYHSSFQIPFLVFIFLYLQAIFKYKKSKRTSCLLLSKACLLAIIIFLISKMELLFIMPFVPSFQIFIFKIHRFALIFMIIKIFILYFFIKFILLWKKQAEEEKRVNQGQIVLVHRES